MKQIFIPISFCMLLLGCDKLPDIKSPISPWTYEEKLNQITNSKIYSAEIQLVPDDNPLIIVGAKLICDQYKAGEGVKLEVSTYHSKVEDKGFLNPLAMKFTALDTILYAGVYMLGAKNRMVIPQEIEDKIVGVSKFPLRLNEGATNSMLYPWEFIFPEFNNQAVIYPFLVEASAKIKIEKLRFEIETIQGKASILGKVCTTTADAAVAG